MLMANQQPGSKAVLVLKPMLVNTASIVLLDTQELHRRQAPLLSAFPVIALDDQQNATLNSEHAQTAKKDQPANTVRNVWMDFIITRQQMSAKNVHAGNMSQYATLRM